MYLEVTVNKSGYRTKKETLFGEYELFFLNLVSKFERVFMADILLLTECLKEGSCRISKKYY